jgi:uncharacterized cupin superfamily protein
VIVDPKTVPCEFADNGSEMVFWSEASGLTQFGVHTDRLMPGCTSRRRHWHDSEDEFMLVLAGTATMVDDDGAHQLHPGYAACWRHGEPNGHHIKNLTDAALTFVIVGAHVALDRCHYPDDGQKQVNGATDWSMVDAGGTVLRSGALPAHLLGLPAHWGTGFDGKPIPRILPKGSVPAVDGSGYPEGFNALGPYKAYPLSDAGGLTQFGAFTEHLMPGSQSSQRHWHDEEDEFLYVLEGEVTVVEDDSAHILTPGMVACWPRGVANAHCLQNRTDTPVFYFVVGTRLPNDRCQFPDIDLSYSRKDGVRFMAHTDSTPYSGWPKGPQT